MPQSVGGHVLRRVDVQPDVLRGLTSKLTGPEQGDGICASVFACTNAGTLCRVRLSDLLGLARFRRGCEAFGMALGYEC